MPETVNADLRARDVYGQWKRRVQAAEESIRVFSPYLDQMLARLLGNAALDVDGIAVVTDLSPTSGALSYRGQLLGVRALLRRGIEVRTLPRLHAKVLQTDGEVTVGSQNFTTYGRSSHETTAIGLGDVSGSQFMDTLDQWFNESEPVDLEFIERLLEELEELVTAVDEAQRALMDGYQALVEEREANTLAARLAQNREEARRTPLGQELAMSIPQHRVRSPAGFVNAWLSYQAPGWDGSGGDYMTLKVDGGSTLTSWMMTNARGKREHVRLARLWYHPLLLASSGQMAYGRVADTRITYLWSGVRWGNPVEIAGRQVRLSVNCPSSGLDLANIVVTGALLPSWDGGFTVELRFGGDEPLVTAAKPHAAPGMSDEVARRVVDALLNDSKEWKKLLSRIFDSFSPQEVGIRNHNADRFFTRGVWHRIEPILVADKPVLVIST